MAHIPPAELHEALRAIVSTKSKCEKVLPKLKPGTSQHTLLTRRIAAFEIAIQLIRQGIDTHEAHDAPAT